MTKTLHILIKYNEQLLQEQKRLLDTLMQTINQLETKREQHYNALEQERHLLRDYPEFTAQFSYYYNSVQEKIDSLNKTIDNVNEQLSPVADKVEALYSEIKKFETIKEQYILQQRKLLDKEEAKMMDELSLIRFLKKQHSS